MSRGRPSTAAGGVEGRLPRRDAARAGALGAGLLLLAVAATLSSGWARYIGDNRFEQYWAPARRLARSFTTWDGSRGLGRVREDFWPGATAPVAILRALGLPPWLAELLWHGLLIAAAGFGVVLLLRAVRPRVGWEHLMAGLCYSFGPYSATFLIPSNLYLGYVLAPWLVLCTWNGLHAVGRDRWAWAGGFALLVFAGGNTDPPGVLFAGIPVLLTGAYLVVVERILPARRALAWAACTAALCVAVSAAALTKVWIAADTFTQRLGDTESPQIANLASSWAESWRGMGFWLSYFREDGALSRPQGEVLFSSWWVVLATFVPPVVAIAVVWLSRWRPRLLFAAMALAALVVMVGAHPVGDPHPFGEALLWAYDRFTLVSAFRGAYKAGAGLALGVAVLFGVAVAGAARRAGGRAPMLGLVPVVLAVLVLAVGAAPFTTGRLYDRDRALAGDVPDYWIEAIDAVDRLPGEGRVLVLPPSTRTQYRWGWVGDDIFDALMERPHAIDTAVPLSTPEAADLLAALSGGVNDDAYTEGSLPAAARRLGIRYVVLRNDLDWRSMGRPRPAELQSLRADPGLRFVRSFGANGENTTAPQDESVPAQQERSLPPVEVYEVIGAGPGLRATTPQPPVLVSGDGQGWTQLAELGLLDGTGPVRYTGSLAADEARAALDDGAEVVVTDSNRRRLTVVSGFEADSSRTLAVGEDLDRPARPLFDHEGSESVARFGGAETISASGNERTVAGYQPWFRPANAFDGDPATVWVTPRLEDPVGRSLVVQLDEPTEISEITVADTREVRPGGRVERLQVELSDGTVEVVTLDETGHGAVSLDEPSEVTSVRLRLIQVSGNVVDGVGLAEVDLGVDLVEHVQLPDDLLRAADQDPELATALVDAGITYSFARSIGDGPLPEERALRRWFRTAGDREYVLAGQVGLSPTTADEDVDALLGGDRGAFGSERYGGELVGHGGLAVDGDLTTGWRSPGRTGEVLTVRFPSTVLQTVRVVGTAGPGRSDPTSVAVRAGPTTVAASMVVESGCDPTATTCQTAAVATFPFPVPSEQVEVEVATIDVELDGLIPFPVEITEVELDEVPNPPRSLVTPFASGCIDLGITIDGTPQLVQAEARVADLLAGDRVELQGCAPVTLDAGWHVLVAGEEVPVSSMSLSSAPAPGSPGEEALVAGASAGGEPPAPTLSVVGREPTEVELTVDAPDGAVLSLGESFDERWRATVDGEDLGPARSFDTLSGWELAPTDGPVAVTLEYRPQRLFEAATAVSLLALVGCVVLIVRARPRSSVR